MTITIEPGRNYTLAQVADWLEHDVEWLYRHRPAMEREGFPGSITRVGQPRFSGQALIDWRERGPLLPADDTPADPKVVDFSAVLAARADALLAGAGARGRRRP